eukprot:g1619.t1
MMLDLRVVSSQRSLSIFAPFRSQCHRSRCKSTGLLQSKTPFWKKSVRSKRHSIERITATRMDTQKSNTNVPAAPIFLPEGDWRPINGGVTAPAGFKASSKLPCVFSELPGVCANLRSSPGKADLSLLLCPTGATAAGVFTQNVLCAAPVLYDKSLLKHTSKIKAVLTNAGQANAATGPEGLVDCQTSASSLSKLLDLAKEDVLVLSTGVIGRRILMENLLASLEPLTSALDSGPDVDQAFATAITTTDLVYKTTAVEFEIQDGISVTVGGVCKGSGMIHPNLATLLGVITCDAPVAESVWKQMLKNAVDLSFNRLTVDGDTSTNDTILALTSGLAEMPLITDLSSSQAARLQDAITAVCQGLAKSVAWDGEGATCLLEVVVKGTKTNEEAGIIAKSIANSSLTKAAVFGHDPNWGRIAAAAGYAGVNFSIDDLDITLGEIPLMKKGVPLDFDSSIASAYLKTQCANHSIVRIEVRVGKSLGEGTVWGCDLSYDYVKINAEYTT